MVDLVNKSKRIGGFAYPYLPILVNISDKHVPPSISQKHLVKPYYLHCNGCNCLLPIILESMDLVHIHVSAANWMFSFHPTHPQ